MTTIAEFLLKKHILAFKVFIAYNFQLIFTLWLNKLSSTDICVPIYYEMLPSTHIFRNTYEVHITCLLRGI